MKIFTALSELPREFADAPAFLCVGNFDGAHRGHRALFRAAKEAAAASGGVCGALTFEPHPEIFFRGPDAVKLNVWGGGSSKNPLKKQWKPVGRTG